MITEFTFEDGNGRPHRVQAESKESAWRLLSIRTFRSVTEAKGEFTIAGTRCLTSDHAAIEYQITLQGNAEDVAKAHELIRASMLRITAKLLVRTGESVKFISPRSFEQEMGLTEAEGWVRT